MTRLPKFDGFYITVEDRQILPGPEDVGPLVQLVGEVNLAWQGLLKYVEYW